jgi:hypothetical protein
MRAKFLTLSLLLTLLLFNASFVNAETTETISVTASVPLTETWKKAIEDNSQVFVSQDKPHTITVFLKGVDQVVIPFEIVIIKWRSKDGLLYQSDIRTDPLGKVEFILPTSFKTTSQISLSCDYDGQIIPLHLSKKIRSFEDLVKHGVDLIHITASESKAVDLAILIKESRLFPIPGVW